MRTIGKKIVAVLIPSGVTAALMLGSIGTANAAENDHKTTPANIMDPCEAPNIDSAADELPQIVGAGLAESPGRARHCPMTDS